MIICSLFRCTGVISESFLEPFSVHFFSFFLSASWSSLPKPLIFQFPLFQRSYTFLLTHFSVFRMHPSLDSLSFFRFLFLSLKRCSSPFLFRHFSVHFLVLILFKHVSCFYSLFIISKYSCFVLSFKHFIFSYDSSSRLFIFSLFTSLSFSIPTSFLSFLNTVLGSFFFMRLLSLQAVLSFLSFYHF